MGQQNPTVPLSQTPTVGQRDTQAKKCPLVTGGPVPNRCLFEAKFFQRMVRDRVIELTEPCPVQRACRIIDK